MLASTPAAMSGSRPMVTNSVVPMANPPRASAPIASPAVRGEGTGGVGVVATEGAALTGRAKPPGAAGIPMGARRNDLTGHIRPAVHMKSGPPPADAHPRTEGAAMADEIRRATGTRPPARRRA